MPASNHDETVAELRELFESLLELRKVVLGSESSILTRQAVNR